jgi:ABC-type multidrug transport system ATPase subunit
LLDWYHGRRWYVSIAVELAANPSILFLDEPITGLDSRAAQALIRNIQTIIETRWSNSVLW